MVGNLYKINIFRGYNYTPKKDRRILEEKFNRSLERFVSLARNFFKDKLDAILVFGSFADPSKELKEDSDIDLVVFHRAREDEVVLFHRLLPTEHRRRLKVPAEKWSWYYDEALKHDTENDVYWHIFYAPSSKIGSLVKRFDKFRFVFVNLEGLRSTPELFNTPT